MADIELVIKIPNDIYHRVVVSPRCATFLDAFRDRDIFVKALQTGTPLPEGHGRMIDENELIDEIVCEEIDGRYYDVIYAHSIYDANTIIAADKAESEDKE